MFLTFVFLLLSYIVWSTACLLRNIQLAKRIGIPVVWSPVRPENPIWLLGNQKLAPCLRKLPFNGWIEHCTLDWPWNDRMRGSVMHRKHGKTFAHATPGKLEVFTADAAVAYQVFTKREGFRKQCDSARKRLQSTSVMEELSMIEILDLYGPSLVTVSGDTWARHRRITARSFGENINRIVWKESVRQANQMVKLWLSNASGVNSVVEDSLTLSLHVLTSAAFGIQYDFDETAEENIPHGHQKSYRQCLGAVLQLQNILLLYFVPGFIYKVPLMSRKLIEARNCSRELKEYLTEFVQSRRAALNTDGEVNSNFLTSLVLQNFESKSGTLNDEELYGNLFTWTFGGHETSANTFSHALFLLAAFPDVQDWLAEELRAIQFEYDSFTRMKRCLAVMFETLRLFPTVTVAPKSTGLSATGVLSEDGVTYTFPSQTDVKANIPTLHIQPDYWGPDSLLWKPSRWIDSSAEETIRAPVKGSFLPWTDGPRVCPGKKFAQVTFVATVATIVSQYKIEVVPGEGEVMEQARERAWTAVQNSYAALTLEIRAPERVKFRLLKRC